MLHAGMLQLGNEAARISTLHSEQRLELLPLPPSTTFCEQVLHWVESSNPSLQSHSPESRGRGFPVTVARCRVGKFAVWSRLQTCRCSWCRGQSRGRCRGQSTVGNAELRTLPQAKQVASSGCSQFGPANVSLHVQSRASLTAPWLVQSMTSEYSQFSPAFPFWQFLQYRWQRLGQGRRT